MTWLVDRLAELKRHIEHLRELRPRVTSAEPLDMGCPAEILYRAARRQHRLIRRRRRARARG